MPKYMLLLDSGTGRPIEEILVAADDAEARMLAELRLSLTTDYLQISIVRDSQLLGTLTRDSVTSGRRRLADGLPSTAGLGRPSPLGRDAAAPVHQSPDEGRA